MYKSLLISSSGHFVLLFVIISFGWEINKQIDPLLNPVQVSVISISEFDAKNSVAPDLNFENLSIKSIKNERKIQKLPLKISLSETVAIDASDKIELDLSDESFISKFDLLSPQVDKTNKISIETPERLDSPEIEVESEQEGNEKNAFDFPVIAQPNPRTSDRIDKVAVAKSTSEKVTDTVKAARKAAVDAQKVQEISEAESPKEASTRITPEGKKDEPIAVSGAVKSSLPPPSRPKKPIKSNNNPPIQRPKAAELLKKDNQVDQIEKLLAQVDASAQKEESEVSLIEKNNMMSAIAQKLAKYWEQGILAGNSNFEKYIVQVKVEVNSLGEIIGGVKPLVPKNPKGRYLIAFRQASNALISAGTLPIIPGKYPSGITFEITFDPEEGFSF